MKTSRKSIALRLLLFTGFVPAQVKPVYLMKSGGGLPSSFDWRDQGIITPVKDQGHFGTCWAFASAGRHWGEEGFGRAAYGQAGIDDYYIIHATFR